jgi:hypothetical protein
MAKYIAWYLPPNAGWSQPVQVLNMPVPPLYPTPTLCRTTSIDTFHHSTSLPARRVRFPTPPTVSCSQASSGDATCDDHADTCTTPSTFPQRQWHTSQRAPSTATRTRLAHNKTSHSRYLTGDGPVSWTSTCKCRCSAQGARMATNRPSLCARQVLGVRACMATHRPSLCACRMLSVSGLYSYLLAFPPHLLDS